MDEHRILYRQVTGPRSGKRWQRIDSGTRGTAFCICGAGTYKITRYCNHWPTGSNIFTVTEQELEQATWAPGKVGTHGFGIEV